MFYFAVVPWEFFKIFDVEKSVGLICHFRFVELRYRFSIIVLARHNGVFNYEISKIFQIVLLTLLNYYGLFRVDVATKHLRKINRNEYDGLMNFVKKRFVLFRTALIRYYLLLILWLIRLNFRSIWFWYNIRINPCQICINVNMTYSFASGIYEIIRFESGKTLRPPVGILNNASSIQKTD